MIRTALSMFVLAFVVGPLALVAVAYLGLGGLIAFAAILALCWLGTQFVLGLFGERVH